MPYFQDDGYKEGGFSLFSNVGDVGPTHQTATLGNACKAAWFDRLPIFLMVKWLCGAQI